ncbi:phBC6A51 family helix-turn-helix protein [Lactobacillus helveticus]|uniref:phBC6A51 family helix-turn-helix protein n=1 Tax=Lactobacillus helveticus TaxID=1587 RepID=UPI001C64E17E|nr:phBC6A51 family helix-turn-helix protein [Lactobacillus helveticus]MBW7985182.1 helix-turn-helix domain-containing protein [Lactobacillus helveticus]
MTQNKAFDSLSKKKRKIVKLLFEDKLTDQEIANTVSCSRSTVARLKQDPIFIQAQQEYAVSVLDHALPDSIRELIKLIRNSKSDMVRLQAIQTVFKRAGLFSDNGTPELDKARIRKANADADLTEAKVRALQGGNNGQENKVIELIGELADAFKESSE